MKIEQQSRNVISVQIDDIVSGWEKWVLLTGDRHHDNVHCDRDRERRDLEKAKERKALVVDVGDLFCAMQGKWDPRSDMSQLRQEDAAPDYLDRIVRHAAEFYEPYADNFLMLGKGNHETKILDRHGTDLTSNLVYELNRRGGHVFPGWLGGWVWFKFRVQKTVQKSYRLKYFHGAGGGGPVTRGVIQTNRQSVYLPDADIVVNGHTHDAWYVPIARERLSQKGVVQRDVIHHLRTPGYKDAYGDGAAGWDVERWGPPKPIGCCWLQFYYEAGTVEMRAMVEVE